MNKIITSIKKNFVLYFLWTIIAVVFIIWGFGMLTKVPEERKIDIFVHAHNVNEEALNSFIGNNKEDYLMEINYRLDESSDTLLNQVMMTYGDVEADLYIFSKTDLEAKSYDSYFYALNEEDCKSIFGNDIDFYRNSDGIAYGIQFSYDFLTETEETYYILFANDSLHLGSLTGSEYNGAITICKALLEGSK